MKEFLKHQALHLAMAVCLFVAGIVFGELHRAHNPKHKLTL